MSDGDNIFSLAGKGRDKPHEPKSHEKLPFSSPPPLAEPMTDEIMEARHQQALKMQDDLQKNLEKIYAASGWTKEAVVRLLDNPSYYEGLETSYEIAQRQRKAMRGELEKMVGSRALEDKEAKEKKKEQDRTRRRASGARRNWLNMR
jgi:hypothetical protein